MTKSRALGMFEDAPVLWHDAVLLWHDAVLFFENRRFFHEQGFLFLPFAILFFVDPAAILQVAGRSKKDAPAVLKHAPVLLKKQNILRTQPPCALFLRYSPFFHAQTMSCDV